MALNMDAAFRIVTTTAGTEKLAALGRGLKDAETNATGANRAFQALGGVGAKMGGILRQIAPALTVAGLVAFGKGTIDTADAMSKLSQRTGVGAPLLDKFRQAANLSDTSIEGVENGLLQLSKSMAAADKGTGKQYEAFKRLGVEFKNADGSLRPLGDVMLDVAGSISNMPGGAEKAAIAMALFGKSGAELIPMLDMGKEGIDGMKTAMTQEFADASAAFNDRLTNIQESLGQLAAVLFMDVFPVFDGLVAAIEKGVVAFTSMPEPAREVLSGLIAFGAAAVLAVGALGILVAIGAKVVAGFVAIKGALAAVALGPVIASWAGAIGPAIAGIIKIIGGILVFVKGVLLPGLLAVFSGPVGWTVLAVAAVVAMVVLFRKPLMEFASWLWNWGEPIREFFVDLWNGAKDAAVGVWEGIKSAVSGAIDWIRERAQGIGDGFAQAWEWVKTKTGEFVNWIRERAQGIGDGFAQAWEWVKTKTGEFVNWIRERFQGVWDAITEPLQPLIESFRNTWDSIKEFMLAYFNWAKDTFYKLYIEPIKLALSALGNLFNAAWNGIKAAGSAVWQSIQSVWQQAAAWFNSNVTTPIRNAWDSVVAWVTQKASAIGAAIGNAWGSISQSFNQYVAQPIRNAWDSVVAWVSQSASAIGAAIGNAWQGVTSSFEQYVAAPVRNAWAAVVAWVFERAGTIRDGVANVWNGVAESFRSSVVEPIQSAWETIVQFLQGVVQNAAGALNAAWKAIAGGVTAAFQGVIGVVGRIVNQVISAINVLIQGVNKVRSVVPGLSMVNTIPQWNVPSFAEGGVVMRPTLALVGEGGEREYIIPESKMARASENYLAGQRGDAVLAAQRFQMATATGGGGITVAPGRSPINITTGPVQQIDGRRYATLDDLEAVAQEVATQIYGTLRTPAGRRAIGVI